ncbi:MAG: type VII toxin-antitoxin system HepT family RNase toxin [bacterium]
MTNFSYIENKVSNVRKYLRILEQYKKYSCEEIKENIDIRGAVERYLYLAIQSTIDLAQAIISLKNLRKPTTMAESFLILEEEGIIDRELSERLVRMVGFRNILAHDYTEINYEIVYEVLHKRLKDIKKFIEEVSEGR